MNFASREIAKSCASLSLASCCVSCCVNCYVITSFYSSYPSNERKYLNPLKDYFRRYTRSVDGCDSWYEVSQKGYDMYQECKGNEFVRFKKGNKYSDLINLLKNPIPYSNIKLNEPVIKIDSTNPDKVKVITESGLEYEADVVIFSGSLGFLKAKGLELFEPSLPDDKIEAIDKIGFGTVDKIYLEFSQPLLPNLDGVNFLHNDRDFNYSPEDAEQDWTRFVLMAYVQDYNPNIISLWLTGIFHQYLSSSCCVSCCVSCRSNAKMFRTLDPVPQPRKLRKRCCLPLKTFLGSPKSVTFMK